MQAKFTEDDLRKVAAIVGVPVEAAVGALGDHWYPYRGIGPIPPKDPVLYRLFEVRRSAYTHSQT